MAHEQEALAQKEALKTILVVEDDSSIGEIIVDAIFQETAHFPILVTDGSQALKTVSQIKPHLFLLDYRLPDINGIELYDKLHTAKELEAIPAIMMSATLPKREVEKRNIVGLRKPFELDELLQTIEQLIA